MSVRLCSACGESDHDRRRCLSLTAAIYDVEDVRAALQRDREASGDAVPGWRERTLERALRTLRYRRDQAARSAAHAARVAAQGGGS